MFIKQKVYYEKKHFGVILSLWKISSLVPAV
jgi:hypothetical protein